MFFSGGRCVLWLVFQLNMILSGSTLATWRRFQGLKGPLCAETWGVTSLTVLVADESMREARPVLVGFLFTDGWLSLSGQRENRSGHFHHMRKQPCSAWNNERNQMDSQAETWGDETLEMCRKWPSFRATWGENGFALQWDWSTAADEGRQCWDYLVVNSAGL